MTPKSESFYTTGVCGECLKQLIIQDFWNRAWRNRINSDRWHSLNLCIIFCRDKMEGFSTFASGDAAQFLRLIIWCLLDRQFVILDGGGGGNLSLASQACPSNLGPWSYTRNFRSLRPESQCRVWKVSYPCDMIFLRRQEKKFNYRRI